MYAPAHYRAFRDFMLAHAPAYGETADEGAHLAPDWDALIHTGAAVLAEAQCEETGLAATWWVASEVLAGEGEAGAGSAGCTGDGSPGDHWGAEAAAAAWRVGVDGLW